jgi:hypothetical protein
LPWLVFAMIIWLVWFPEKQKKLYIPSSKPLWVDFRPFLVSNKLVRIGGDKTMLVAFGAQCGLWDVSLAMEHGERHWFNRSDGILSACCFSWRECLGGTRLGFANI